ncbi:hypothetical protein BO82DRAFT_361514 [Aspergillus uvarum CBS 121591]|uniref:Uncharacterized protein n=1 Tax=Aspergillus uvarum CBS 121591 TaxID=1448315 RepID=A0A319CNC0_9EURO|nr:hypothetical protein BO82DRAFT_361514 [Aspergillus uvarum CBS 121591]PYH85581.1 hypothetical protein BO82DRAFT_361514 [Aspergillus uvarum CBS 121591]
MAKSFSTFKVHWVVFSPMPHTLNWKFFAIHNENCGISNRIMSESSPNFRHAHPELYWPEDLARLREMAQPYKKQEIARARNFIIAALAAHGIAYRFEVNDKWSKAVWLWMDLHQRFSPTTTLTGKPISVIRPGTSDQNDPNPFRPDLFVVICEDQRLIEVHCQCEGMSWSDQLSLFQRELWLDVKKFGDEFVEWDRQGPLPASFLERYLRLMQYAGTRPSEVHAVRTRLDRRGTMALVHVYKFFHPVRTHKDWDCVQRLRHTFGAWRDDQLYDSRLC